MKQFKYVFLSCFIIYPLNVTPQFPVNLSGCGVVGYIIPLTQCDYSGPTYYIRMC